MKNNIEPIKYFALLAAGIKQDVKGSWVSTDLTPADNALGSPGGKLRVYATAFLVNKHPGSFVITGGGKGYDVLSGTPENRPLLAEILLDELIEEGVSKDRIILETNSNNTFQELHEILRIVKDKEIKQLCIITNRWHVERLGAMISSKYAELRSMADVSILAAEDILLAAEPLKWEEQIREAYESDWMHERLEMESRGALQIKAGTYKFR